MSTRATSLRPAAALLILASTLLGCAAIATSPPWVGGGMAVTGPVRAARRAAVEAEQRSALASQPDEIRARHILVMHEGSKAKPEGVKRTREQAAKRAQECLEKLRAGTDFAALVAEYSDEPGAAEREGDLGTFRREVMIQSFSEVAFELAVGEISEVVETPYGFHIIQRTE